MITELECITNKKEHVCKKAGIKRGNADCGPAQSSDFHYRLVHVHREQWQLNSTIRLAYQTYSFSIASNSHFEGCNEAIYLA